MQPSPRNEKHVELTKNNADHDFLSSNNMWASSLNTHNKKKMVPPKKETPAV